MNDIALFVGYSYMNDIAKLRMVICIYLSLNQKLGVNCILTPPPKNK